MSIQELIELINNEAPLNEIETLVETGIDINEPVGDMGLCALHHAVYKNRPECVLYLVNHGCNINVQDQCGFTPLHVASRYNRVDVMRELLQLGANLETEDAVGCPALNLALQKGYEECAESLLEKGANPNKHYKHVGYEIHQLPPDTPKCLELLLQHGADPELRNPKGLTALHVAIKGGNILYVYILLQHGANSNATCATMTSHNRWSALHLSVIRGERGITELLLLYGADPNIKDVFGNSALHHVAAHGQVTIAQLLVNHGAIVALNNERKYQPLHRACASSIDPDMITLLLENGADARAQTILLETPMQLLLSHITNIPASASPDCQKQVLCLINYGARVTIKSDNNDTDNIISILLPLSIHHLAVIRLLLGVAEEIFIPPEETDLLQGLDEYVRDYILMLSRNVRSLKHLARKVVRQCLETPCNSRNVNALEIPKSLKNYLLYS
ncbi:ankyrin repeat and SOCS box protein 16-like [Amphiura filiformis]|uniref:ankyrin repeat and SOCS box protein 16-like n=1 Tax=Amphiura filiformis TaxID=82378 RepID=UPI003B21F581